MGFREIKRHLNKPDETYLCELIGHAKGQVTLRYVSDREWRVAGAVLPVGATTFARYVEGRDFVLWKMVSPDGAVAGYLFHICSDLEISECEVRYLDLLLDIWVDAAGKPTVLDRDEVEDCRRSGQLSEKQMRAIAREEERILARWPEFIAELERFGTALTKGNA